MYFGEFCYLNSSWIRKSITLIIMSSSRNKFTLLNQNSVTDVFVGFRPPCWCPSRWTLHGVSIQVSINLGKTFLRISRIRNIFGTWILARVFVYLRSFISQILDFIYWTVLIFYFDLFWMAWHWKPAIQAWMHIEGEPSSFFPPSHARRAKK